MLLDNYDLSFSKQITLVPYPVIAETGYNWWSVLLLESNKHL